MGGLSRSFIRPGSRRASDMPSVRLSPIITTRYTQAPGQFSVPAERNSTAPMTPNHTNVCRISLAIMTSLS